MGPTQLPAVLGTFASPSSSTSSTVQYIVVIALLLQGNRRKQSLYFMQEQQLRIKEPTNIPWNQRGDSTKVPQIGSEKVSMMLSTH